VKVAIMQPYFLPYIGYWQLMAAVDKFILLDDVNFIKGGWINRNRILSSNGPAWITIPLVGASPNRLINELDIAPDNGWKRKMIDTVSQSYSRSEHYGEMLGIFQRWIDEAAKGNLSSFLHRTIEDIRQILGLPTEIIPTATIFPKNGLSGVERVLDICRRTGADTYINAPGGRELYIDKTFVRSGVKLQFVETKSIAPNIDQWANALSILHALFAEPRLNTSERIRSFSLK
jgi:hypothetical protein